MTATTGGPAPAPEADRPRGRFVIVTAGIGAGHDVAAREWAVRLRERGYAVDVHDLLDLLPARSTRSLRDGYHWVLEHVPWVWALIFRLTAFPPLTALAVRAAARHRHRVAAVIPSDTVAVLSTYALAGQILGRLRTDGALTVPAVSFLTDMAVHPLCVSAGVDLHLTLSDHAAAEARRLGAAHAEVSGPVVPPQFRPGSPSARVFARKRFGLPTDGRTALLVAGSWGVGAVERAAEEVAASGAATPVIACGRNEDLRNRLVRRGIGIPLGWTDDMDLLPQGVDVLVENAGGMSSLEALATGVPVVTYHPIPGHGRKNAAALQQAGVSSWIRRPTTFAPMLAHLLDGPRGAGQVARGRALFRADPAAAVLAQVGTR